MNKMEMFLFKSGQFTVMLVLDAWNVLLFELLDKIFFLQSLAKA